MTKTQELIETIRTRHAETVATYGEDVNAWSMMWADGKFDGIIDSDRQDETDIGAAHTICLVNGEDVRTAEVLS